MIARIWRRLRGTRQTPLRVASAVGLGLFIGCLPIYGLHFFLCSLICLPLGLDLVLAYLVANISNPFVAPFLVTLEVEVGSLLTTGQHAAFTLERARQAGFLGYVWEAGIGSVFVGALLGGLGAALSYVVARRRKPLVSPSDDASVELDAAIARTVLRYASLPRADRFAVAGKLRFDPLTKMLAALPRDLGRVLDAGAGRGQFGLLLWELGCCASLAGLDADARKVQAAQAAAQGDAEFVVCDLLELSPAEFDTLLLFDVLHYLSVAEQDELLRRAAARIARGRILIRELDGVRGARSSLTRLSEGLATRFDVHRGRAGHHYRPIAELVERLRELGFSCELHGASEGTPFANVLIVATRVTSAEPAQGLGLSPGPQRS